MPPFGPFEHIQQMVGSMSVPELTQLARNPTGSDPNIQFAAVSEIQRRNAMRAPPTAPGGPQPSVIEKMAMEAMTPPPTAPTPGDPIRSGLMAMAAQQQQGPGGPAPQGMSKGGPVRYDVGGAVRGSAGSIMNNMQGIMGALGPHFDTTAMTPEEVQSLIGQFYGNGDYLNEDPQFKDEEVDARRDRNQSLWLALARAGFGMAQTGNIGQGAIMGLDAANSAMSDYRDERRSTRDRRSRNRQARGAREDRMAGQGLEVLLADRNRAEQADQNLLSSASGIASAGAQIDSANARDRSRLREIADALWEENQGTVVDDPNYRFPDGSVGPNRRLYTRQDAMHDAITMAGGRGGLGGRSPDDLSERLRAALFMAHRVNGGNQAQQRRARQIIEAILNGEVGNANTSTQGGGGTTARGNAAPSEGGYNAGNVRGLDSYRQERFVPEPNTPYTYDENGNRVNSPRM